MQKKIKGVECKAMSEVAERVLDLLGGRNVVLLEGELGAGKTTLSQSILKTMEAEGPFTSPTFVVVKDYAIKEKKGFRRIFHFDCYRITEDDLSEIGWEEIIKNKNNLVLVEWPKRIQNALPGEYLHVKIDVIDEDKRNIFIKSN